MRRTCAIVIAASIPFAVASGAIATGAAAAPSNPPANIPPNPDFVQSCANGTAVIDNTQPCLAAAVQAINNARAQEGVGPLILPTHFATMPVEEQLMAVTDRERVDRGLPPFTGLVQELDNAAQQGAHAAQDPPVSEPSYSGGSWKGTSDYANKMPNALGADYFWMYEDGWGGSASATLNVDCTGPSSSGCWSHRDGILDSYNNLPQLTMGAALDASSSNGSQAWTLLLMGTAGQPSGYTSTWADVLADTPGTGSSCSSGPPSSGKVGRLAGGDRVATAVLASQQQFPAAGSAGAVVVASETAFPDALAGGPLAVAKSAPLLINAQDRLLPANETEIKRVLPAQGTVYVLGGTLALGQSVADQLTADGFTVRRVFGDDRFATAVAIAGVLGNPSTVLEATGTDFADALAAGPAASIAQGVVLLTNGDQQASATASYLSAHPGTHYAIGGPAGKADPSASPIVGGDRYSTAVQVTKTFFPSPTGLGFATGSGFVDALAGGPVIAKSGGMLLVPKCPPLPSSVVGYLQSVSSSVSTGTLFGGTFVVSNDTLAQLDQALTPPG
jgi:putative cell wall-binding protein